MRPDSQASSVGSPEKPWPGSDGRTRWKASSARPPSAVGSVSGPMTSSSSTTEPGQPCVMISGRVFGYGDGEGTDFSHRPHAGFLLSADVLTQHSESV